LEPTSDSVERVLRGARRETNGTYAVPNPPKPCWNWLTMIIIGEGLAVALRVAIAQTVLTRVARA
jgi:hypothetical protein